MSELLIRGGTLIDGTGRARRRADVMVDGGVITEIGLLGGRKAKRIVEAEGQIVSPGFVDVHTHMDAQIAWDPMGESSCFHGVTTAVMGNCGFTLAPVRSDERHLVVRNLERAEDISAEAMAAGIDWSWETFPEYLNFVDRTPKGINYAGYIGHSALRTWAMGERAFEDSANEDDLALMVGQLRSAMKSGAMGFTTSVSVNHATSDDRPVASRMADWSEVELLVSEMGKLGAGIFELAHHHDLRSRDLEKRELYISRLVELAVRTGVPFTYGMLAAGKGDLGWKPVVELLDRINSAGGRSWAQVHTRQFGVLLSFSTQLPFDSLPIWKELRKATLEDQLLALRNPEMRSSLMHEAEHKKPIDVFFDVAVANNLDIFFIQAAANQDQSVVLDLMKHPFAIPTFSDSGAHVTQIMDSSIQTHLLGHWVRNEKAFSLEEAIHRMTLVPARAWGFDDRGVLAEGKASDINIFDSESVSPNLPELLHDLPSGAARLRQTSVGIKATIVNGEILVEDGETTGATPGMLLRGPLAS